MVGKYAAASVIFILAISPVLADRPGSLDVIPDDAVAGIVIRRVSDLKKKGDELFALMQVRRPVRPSQDIDMLLQFLGISAGFDPESPLALVLAHPKYIGAKEPEHQELLVLTVPFTDRAQMAGNFGLTAQTLKPDRMVALPQKHVAGNFGKFVYVHENRLFLGNDEKATLSVVKATATSPETYRCPAAPT